MLKNEFTLKDIVRSWLEAAGFDGLYDAKDACSCSNKNLFECKEPCLTCKPGYLQTQYGETIVIRKEKEVLRPIHLHPVRAVETLEEKGAALILEKRDLLARFLHSCWVEWMKEVVSKTITDRHNGGIIERHLINQLDFSIWKRRAHSKYDLLTDGQKNKYEKMVDDFLLLEEKNETGVKI